MVIVTKINTRRPVIRYVIGAGAIPITIRIVIMITVTEPLVMVIMIAFVTVAGDDDTDSDYSTGFDDCDRGVMMVVIAWPVYYGCGATVSSMAITGRDKPLEMRTYNLHLGPNHLHSNTQTPALTI